MQKKVEKFIELAKVKGDYATFYIKEVLKTGDSYEFQRLLFRHFKQKKKEDKRFYYMITFTLDEKKKEEINYKPKSDLEMQKYIISRLRRKALKIEKAHIVKELTEAGVPHWHVAVKALKYISKDRFKYYIKLYGNIDISKNHSQNYETIIKYISKSDTPYQLIPINKGEL